MIESMNSHKLNIWCNNDFTPGNEREIAMLTEGVGKHRLLMFDENDSGSDALESLRSAQIAFGYPSPAAVLSSQTLRWVQLNSAGYTNYDTEEIKGQLRAQGI